MRPTIPTSSPPSKTRVRKACQRCKVKKTKCDGAYPCQKCKEADEVCVFNPIRRMESRPKPRGYAEMLEEQQKRLASGLRRMYRRLREAELWDGPELVKTEGQPSILDILAELNRIDPPTDDECSMSPISEDEAAVRKEEIPEGGHVMNFDQAATELIEFEPCWQPVALEPAPEMFNMIDWDTAQVCTPLAIETLSQESDMSNMSPIVPLSNSRVRNYSIQMMEAQAQQAGITKFAPIGGLTNSFGIF